MRPVFFVSHSRLAFFSGVLFLTYADDRLFDCFRPWISGGSPVWLHILRVNFELFGLRM